ncbi:MAG: ABC transporter ATP-binding protein, partial [Methylococcales bacterium]
MKGTVHVIEVDDVSKCYRFYDKPRDRLFQSLFHKHRNLYREFWALQHVSMRIKPGEAVAIIGRNGAGKSTLLQLIAGVLRPTSGRLQVNGKVAALLQLGTGFNPEFTGRENVFLNGAILGFSREDIKRRFDEIAGFADIGDFIEQPVKTYSSGMIMRLAFSVSV